MVGKNKSEFWAYIKILLLKGNIFLDGNNHYNMWLNIIVKKNELIPCSELQAGEIIDFIYIEEHKVEHELI